MRPERTNESLGIRRSAGPVEQNMGFDAENAGIRRRAVCRNTTARSIGSLRSRRNVLEPDPGAECHRLHDMNDVAG